jgi:hypothetical protein
VSPDNEKGSIFSELLFIRESLADAESLLKFASESGIAVDEKTRNDILGCRAAFHKGLDQTTTADLLVALAKLGSALAPVTAESLREYTRSEKRPPSHTYKLPAIALAVFLVVYSTLSFVTSAIAQSIRADIVVANALAVKLTAEFEPPQVGGRTSDEHGQTPPQHTTPGFSDNTHAPLSLPAQDSRADLKPSELPVGLNKVDVITDLQLYAATTRRIYAHALELSVFTFSRKTDPFQNVRRYPDALHAIFELQMPLVNYENATVTLTSTYQQVRYFAQNVADVVLFWYGAVSSCTLPVLYALLGACAYLLRSFEQHMTTRTYVPSAADSARFIIAAIGGAVVGLFPGLTPSQAITASPLALAFLVGYAVDVFYAFLESLIQSFTRSALASMPGPPTVKQEAAPK